jgi:hypothetical protein
MGPVAWLRSLDPGRTMSAEARERIAAQRKRWAKQKRGQARLALADNPKNGLAIRLRIRSSNIVKFSFASGTS